MQQSLTNDTRLTLVVNISIENESIHVRINVPSYVLGLNLNVIVKNQRSSCQRLKCCILVY
jgi:hypothetical protein